jgi:hypothetical protein
VYHTHHRRWQTRRSGGRSNLSSWEEEACSPPHIIVVLVVVVLIVVLSWGRRGKRRRNYVILLRCVIMMTLLTFLTECFHDSVVLFVLQFVDHVLFATLCHHLSGGTGAVCFHSLQFPLHQKCIGGLEFVKEQ